uniref:VWFA domain-containing protein n=1 Tax=Plectus sambesii TaxID=2011161 RepID=A0A914W454_9BILA
MRCLERLISVFSLICLRVAQAADCIPPVVDLLFIIDGTVNVGALNFEKIKDFAVAYTRTMDIGVRASRVALAQFTPQAKAELYLVNSIDLESVVRIIHSVPYAPCAGCSGAASINKIAQFAMNTVSGNREWVPDALVIVSSDIYRPPEAFANETLLQPVSPIHAFDINVGSIQHNQVNLPYAATTVKLSAKDFSSLTDLVAPLCESMVTYAKRGSVGDATQATSQLFPAFVVVALSTPDLSRRSAFGGAATMADYRGIADMAWWQFLGWNNSRCLKENSDKTVSWTVSCNNVATGAFGSCAFILILVIITAIILLLMFGYIIYKYKKENDMLKSRTTSTDFQDINQWTGNRTGQQERDRLNRIADAEASNVYTNAAEVGVVGSKVVNTKVINGKLYNDSYGDDIVTDGRQYDDRNGDAALINGNVYHKRNNEGAVINGKLYNNSNRDGAVANGKLYNDRGAGVGGGSDGAGGRRKQRQKGAVINGSAEERIVDRVVNRVVGNVAVKKPKENGDDTPNNRSAEGRIVDRLVNGVVTGVLGRNRGKPLTYDDSVSDDVELGHDTNYQQRRDRNGRLIDEQDRHRLENAANNLAEASTNAGTSTILGDGNTLRSAVLEDNATGGNNSPTKDRKDETNRSSPRKEVHVRVGNVEAENSPDKQRKSIVSPLNLGHNDSSYETTLTSGKHHKDGDDIDHPNSVKDTITDTETDSEAELEKEYSELERQTKARNKSHLPRDHPARKLAPVDVLLVVDNSGSIGMVNFEKVKNFLESLLDGVDISPGRSRVAMVVYSSEPTLHFSFEKYYSNKAVRAAVKRMPYQGTSTFLAKALSFAAGVLAQEQNMKHIKKRKHKYLPTPHHDRLQVMIVASDGYSEDNFEKVSGIFHDKLRVKVAALAVRSFHKERLLPITRFDGSIFLLDQKEAMSNWLWKQQRLWQENFAQYVEKEKSAMENTFRSMTDSPRKKK